MIRKFVLAGAAVLTLGACSLPVTKAASAPAASPASSAVPSASPSVAASPAVDLPQLRIWVEAAELTPAAVGSQKPINDDSGPNDGIEICNQPLSGADQPDYAHYWRWAGTRINYVEHTVAGYTTTAGTQVIADLKTREHACGTYKETDSYATADLSLVGDYALPVPAGAAGIYAYCELTVTVAPAKLVKNGKGYICTANIARGALVDTVRVFSSSNRPTLANAKENLVKAVAVANTALNHALPATYR